jgi:CBS domain-containing protein
MKTAQDIMTKEVACIEPNAKVSKAIQFMRECTVGSLLVGRRSPADTWGIITRTDIVQKVLATGKDIEQTEIADVMTKPITTVRPDTSLLECARLMARDHIRRVFVFDGHNIVGVVSATDIFRTL